MHLLIWLISEEHEINKPIFMQYAILPENMWIKLYKKESMLPAAYSNDAHASKGL